MRPYTLDILRCPCCGGDLSLDTSTFHQASCDEVEDGVLRCACSAFPIVNGIPVMRQTPAAEAARRHVVSGQPGLARRAMLGLEGERAVRFEAELAESTATYRSALDALGPDDELRYFLYRFSDPSYVVADALVRAVAGPVLRSGGRAIDLCGGTGHLTRTMAALSPLPPVLLDLYFLKLWLARRFVAPGCEAVCGDANMPFPFARGVFQYAMCADAFMFVWPKRQFVREMLRLIDDGRDGGVAVISHTHNQRQWSPSLGQPLPPEGYRDLFETLAPRLFAEGGLFADVVHNASLNMARRDSPEALDADPALVIVASGRSDTFRTHRSEASSAAAGTFRINPLYAVADEGDRMRLRLQFPSKDYEAEFGACREYLPATAVVTRASLETMAGGRLPAELEELARRRVILDLPVRYY
jgi:uncharacterized protein YbaR (Trm112 family)